MQESLHHPGFGPAVLPRVGDVKRPMPEGGSPRRARCPWPGEHNGTGGSAASASFGLQATPPREVSGRRRPTRRPGAGTTASSAGDHRPGQANWRFCSKCQGLWFAGNATREMPGRRRTKVGSGNYTLAVQSGGQTNWRWCNKCQGLWFAGNPTPSKCPAGGLTIKPGAETTASCR
jgi:hypothetical protein